MEAQLKYMSKEELHRMIDETPEDELMVLTYSKDTGISDNGKKVKKKKTKNLVDKATILVLNSSKYIDKIDLEGNFSMFPVLNRSIVKSILFPKLE